MFSLRTVVLCVLVLTTYGNAWARAELRLGGEGNQWSSLCRNLPYWLPGAIRVCDRNPVTYAVVEEDGNVLREVSVRVIDEAGGGTYLQEYFYRGPDLPDMSGNVLKPQLYDPEVNLAEKDTLEGNGGTLAIAGHGQSLDPINDAIDTTMLLRVVRENPLITNTIKSDPAMWVYAFGRELPINRIRFYPREGLESNYLQWFEIQMGDNDAPKQSKRGTRRPGHSQMQEFRAGGRREGAKQLPPDSQLDVLFSTRENLLVDTDLHFPVHHMRFVTLRPLIAERTWEVAEWEVYAEGYPRRRVWRSEILDFGSTAATFSKIRWGGERPPGTQLQIRTRTGHARSPSLFWATGRTGLLAQSDADKWITAGIDPQNRTHNVDNWSFWSPVYDFEAGLRDPDTPAHEWQDGTPFQSPGPRQYLQFEIVFESTLTRAPRVDSLVVLFAEAPAAEAVVGEIWPVEVDNFEPQMFTYVVNPTLARGNSGFDRLEILTGSRADTVRSVLVGGEEVIDRGAPETIPDILPDRLIVKFDKLQDPSNDNQKRIEVIFDARVLRFGAEFSGWVYDSDEPELKQQVEPGNATFRFLGDDLSVRTPLGGNLLQRLTVSSPVFSPNGDGVNDGVSIAFDVRDLNRPRQIAVEIFDLSGRLLRQVLTSTSSSHSFNDDDALRWDGRDDSGNLVPPGSYLLRVTADTDQGVDSAMRVLSLAY